MDPSTISDTQYRDAAYKAYFQQTVCTMSLLDDLLGTLDREGLLDDATVIIQGDHGSRITLVDPVATTQDSVTSRDFIDGFSTLFAIHSPVTEPGYDGTPRSIQNLFGELVLNKSITDYENTVFLRTGPRIRKRPMKAVTMPAFE
jgi:arylsulfatase A-like enzyme